MISETEVAWIQDRYPTLKLDAGRTKVSGQLIFAAAYDEAIAKFTPLILPGQTASGLILRGSHEILIEQGDDVSSLPSFWITDDKIEKTTDRHFYDNGRACLCGDIEAIEFMRDDYSFTRYLERLVYPFLYAQRFADRHGRWPWPAYAHGAVGALQSYYRAGKTKEHAEACLRRLTRDTRLWSRFTRVLRGLERVTESSDCFCPRRRKIRECHVDSWLGLIKLRGDLNRFSIPLTVFEASRTDEKGSETGSVG